MAQTWVVQHHFSETPGRLSAGRWHRYNARYWSTWNWIFDNEAHIISWRTGKKKQKKKQREENKMANYKSLNWSAGSNLTISKYWFYFFFDRWSKGQTGDYFCSVWSWLFCTSFYSQYIFSLKSLLLSLTLSFSSLFSLNILLSLNHAFPLSLSLTSPISYFLSLPLLFSLFLTINSNLLSLTQSFSPSFSLISPASRGSLSFPLSSPLSLTSPTSCFLSLPHYQL